MRYEWLQLGRVMGRGRIHKDGEEQGQPVWHCLAGQLPPCLSRRRAPTTAYLNCSIAYLSFLLVLQVLNSFISQKIVSLSIYFSVADILFLSVLPELLYNSFTFLSLHLKDPTAVLLWSAEVFLSTLILTLLRFTSIYIIIVYECGYIPCATRIDTLSWPINNVCTVS